MFSNSFNNLLPKSFRINWLILLFSLVLSSVGCLFLYSAAGGTYDPWSKTQMLRYFVGVCVYIYVSSVNIRLWLSLSYFIYFISLLLLVLVYLFGDVGMGAQRWLDFGFMIIQPSELVKFSLILLIARYYYTEK